MKNKKLNFIIFNIICVIIIILGVYTNNFISKYNTNLVTQNATIHQQTTSNSNVTLYIEFKRNKKVYSSVVSTDKKVDISKKITVYCNKNSLNSCVMKKQKNIGPIIVIIGLIAIIFNIIYFKLNKTLKYDILRKR